MLNLLPDFDFIALTMKHGTRCTCHLHNWFYGKNNHDRKKTTSVPSKHKNAVPL